MESFGGFRNHDEHKLAAVRLISMFVSMEFEAFALRRTYKHAPRKSKMAKTDHSAYNPR